MAYSKLYKAESDVPIGYQTVNQLRDNLEAHRDALAAKHGTETGPGPIGGGGYLAPPWRLNPLNALGRHNAPEFPRAVAYVSHDANGNPYIQWASPQISSVFRLSLGFFFVPVPGLSGYWAKGCLYEETDPALGADFGLMITVRPMYPGGSGTPGLYVQTYRRSSSVVELADGIDFSVTCYARSA